MLGLGMHLRLRLKEDRPIAETLEQRRLVARVVLRQGRASHLVVFAQPDNHLHIYARCAALAAARLAQRIQASLTLRLHLSPGFEPAWQAPLRDGKHAFHLIRYVLTQHQHHGVTADAWREASNLPDLLGLRIVGGYTAQNLQRLLPRLTRDRLLSWFGVRGLRPWNGPTDRLREATLAATALPSLRGRTPEVVVSRRAAVHAASPFMGTSALSGQLGISPRTVRDLRSQTADMRLVKAIRLQLGLLHQRSR